MRQLFSMIGAAALASLPVTPVVAQSGDGGDCRDGQNRWVTLLNLTPERMYRVYERAPGTSDWGRDKLGDVALPAGGRVLLSMSSAGCRCQADIRMTFEANRRQEVILRSVNVCGGQQTIWAD